MARWSEVIKLISITTTKNNIGDSVETPIKRQVFANKKDVRQSEFYQAQVTELRPEIMFQIHSVDYNGEEELEYNEKRYRIIRTYSPQGEILELVCQGLNANG